MLELNRQADLLRADQAASGDALARQLMEEHQLDERFAPVVREALAELLREQDALLTREMEELYARTYTDAELLAAIAFAESPVGRAISAKGVQLAAVLARRSVELNADFFERFYERACAKAPTLCTEADRTSPNPTI